MFSALRTAHAGGEPDARPQERKQASRLWGLGAECPFLPEPTQQQRSKLNIVEEAFSAGVRQGESIEKNMIAV